MCSVHPAFFKDSKGNKIVSSKWLRIAGLGLHVSGCWLQADRSFKDDQGYADERSVASNVQSGVERWLHKK